MSLDICKTKTEIRMSHNSTDHTHTHTEYKTEPHPQTTNTHISYHGFYVTGRDVGTGDVDAEGIQAVWVEIIEGEREGERRVHTGLRRTFMVRLLSSEVAVYHEDVTTQLTERFLLYSDRRLT